MKSQKTFFLLLLSTHTFVSFDRETLKFESLSRHNTFFRVGLGWLGQRIPILPFSYQHLGGTKPHTGVKDRKSVNSLSGAYWQANLVLFTKTNLSTVFCVGIFAGICRGQLHGH